MRALRPKEKSDVIHTFCPDYRRSFRDWRRLHRCFARRGSDAGPVGRDRRRTRPAFQRRFPLTRQGQAHLEDIRREERCRERARIAHELHDTLLQGFLGASMLLHQAVEQTPADSPSKPALRHALRLVRRAIDEGRAAIRGLHVPPPAASSLEQAFSDLLSEITPDPGVRPRRTRQSSSNSF
jgi:signal transduction histidine kinase